MEVVWQKLTIKIKNEYDNLLQDIEASTIVIVPLNLQSSGRDNMMLRCSGWTYSIPGSHS
ncbi:hypothetical protein RhiirA5_441089 [Rhizophagus irregularis]|uniref:Uncharacterized protein n=1 Tax=Rhizophagus irregularis TaxID=588596 RepID=A0A2I1FNM4_9GLOM|nr:hypothetical protein RhiirA5_441089 [Rhizophagus irregularis]PKY35961.1 hypothetical protein RhiirB3_457627 [Rhizophagus irregularis]